ncbi:hypothetical protein DUNSADRAFT_6827 [Dunaliella salina]|uniref:Protein EARLY FLOWERING 4 domain-containing protein n=1 Tax=Dunaliella salina TaxID=3046 RepID=A0ABQ7GMK7_DUNSA|nr:hypothetical protein DUNSADRAFT_6827 [Dunaliella salina]|eukprot:KAF5835840.1 hypothetical protein DUNSADRAFT_6827 [Dunaliella salina]
MAGQPSRSSADPLQQWPGIEKLNSVQDLLDQNKLLIAQINEVVNTYSLLASQVEGDQQQLPQQQQQQQQMQPPQLHHHHHHHHH